MKARRGGKRVVAATEVERRSQQKGQEGTRGKKPAKEEEKEQRRPSRWAAVRWDGGFLCRADIKLLPHHCGARQSHLSARSTAESDGVIENSMDVASCAGCSPHRDVSPDDSSDPTIKYFFLDLETEKPNYLFLIQSLIQTK